MFIWLGRKAYRAIQARRAKGRAGSDGAEDSSNTVSPSSTNTKNEGAVILDPQAQAAKKAERKALIIKRAKLMGALVIPVFLETLDYTVVATAQPHIASAFNRLDLQSYIGTVYLLTSTVFLPLFASVADVFGRHWAMQISLLFFLVGSALSTAAQNMPMMLAGRGIAGIGAAGLLTVVRVILSDSSSLDDNNWQAATLVALYSVGFCVGPTIGGALLEVNFRWIFAINLPTTALSMVLAFFLLRGVTKGPQPLAGASSSDKTTFLQKFLLIDWPASFLFCGGGILLLLGLNWGSVDADATTGWSSARVIASLIIGGVMLISTLGWDAILEGRLARRFGSRFRAASPKEVSDSEALPGSAEKLPDKRNVFTPTPLLPISLFTSYDVVATEFAALTAGMVMIVLFYFVAMFMVIVTGLSAVSAGVQLIYFAPGMGGGTIIAITMIKRLRQPKYPICLGTLIVPIALGLLAMAVHENKQNQVNGFMVMAGVGVGMTFGPLAIHARFSQPEERVAIVVALNLFFRSLGGTIGLAQCFTVLNSKVRAYFTSLPPSVFEASGLTPESLSSAGSASLSSTNSIDSLPPAAQELVRNAFRNGVRWSFISMIPWTGLAFIFVLFLSNISDSDMRERMKAVEAHMNGKSDEKKVEPERLDT